MRKAGSSECRRYIRKTREEARKKKKHYGEKKRNLNKEKGKRGKEGRKEGEREKRAEIPTQSKVRQWRARKKFSPCRSDAEDPAGRGECEGRCRSRRGRRRTRKEGSEQKIEVGVEKKA